jgi:hypothetical protein
MKHTLTATGLAVVAFTFGVTGTALANFNYPDASCLGGLTFDMPRGEDGTEVRVTLDGTQVYTETVATFGAPVVFAIPSPDTTRPHVWTVVVDSQWHDDTSWTKTVPACTTPATVPTTVPAPPTTAVATAVPPTPTTVVAPPRTPTPAAPITPQVESATPGTLPATGPAQVFLLGLVLSALACLTVGWYAVRAARK